MAYQVRLTDDAAADLAQLYTYITRHDSRENAEKVLARVEELIDSLTPARGAYPAELAELGIRDFRELLFKPYRLIYRIIGKIVYMYLIVDGRRDVRSVLQERLLQR